VFGYTPDEYSEAIQILEDAPGLSAYELNISCPNVKQGGIQFGSDPVMVSQVVGVARRAAANRPLWVKLSPLVTDIGLIARSAEEAGADGLTVANTYPAMSLDSGTGRSRLGCPTGGLSGPAIRPITVRLVWEASKAVDIPIVGLGGIEKVEDVLEYLMAGAAAVQVGTASFVSPSATQTLAGDLQGTLEKRKCNSINELIGGLGLKLD